MDVREVHDQLYCNPICMPEQTLVDTAESCHSRNAEETCFSDAFHHPISIEVAIRKVTDQKLLQRLLPS